MHLTAVRLSAQLSAGSTCRQGFVRPVSASFLQNRSLWWVWAILTRPVAARGTG